MTILFELGLTNALLTAILAIFAYAITRIWTNAHLAHFLWLIVLLKMVTPPLVSVPISLGFHWNATESASSSPINSDKPSLASFSDTKQVSQAIEPVEASKLSEEMPFASAVNQKKSDTLGASVKTTISWPVYVGTVWLVGSFIWGLIACIRIVKFHRKLKEADVAGESVQRIGQSVAKKLGLKRCPELRITNGHLSPMVWPVCFASVGR